MTNNVSLLYIRILRCNLIKCCPIYHPERCCVLLPMKTEYVFQQHIPYLFCPPLILGKTWTAPILNIVFQYCTIIFYSLFLCTQLQSKPHTKILVGPLTKMILFPRKEKILHALSVWTTVKWREERKEDEYFLHCLPLSLTVVFEFSHLCGKSALYIVNQPCLLWKCTLCSAHSTL